MTEIWRPVVGYEGKYEVSNYGHVRSLFKNRGKIRKSVINKSGYCVVGLYSDGREVKHFVHRLVATAFIENPHDYPEVNHKDEDKSNNHVENLEWCNHKYNMDYKKNLHPKFMLCKEPKKRIREVNQYTKDGQFIRKWSCVMEIEREMGLNADSIWSCCNRGHSSQGYRWEFAS